TAIDVGSGGRDDEPGAIEVVGYEAALHDDKAIEQADLRADLGRDDGDEGSGPHELRQLGARYAAAADHHHLAAAELEEDGKEGVATLRFVVMDAVLLAHCLLLCARKPRAEPFRARPLGFLSWNDFRLLVEPVTRDRSGGPPPRFYS